MTDTARRAGSRTFGERLRVTMDTFGAVCVGIDPHPELLTAWGLPVAAEGVREFARTCVAAFAGRVAAVKPQSAFFEEYGSAGVAVLEEILADFHSAGTPVILDVKRGDIGSTMAGYARAYLADQAPLAADAITVSPYLGFRSLSPAMDLAAATHRGVFVLALTSNPEGRDVQHVADAGGAWRVESSTRRGQPMRRLLLVGSSAVSASSSARRSARPSPTSGSTSRAPMHRSSRPGSAPKAARRRRRRSSSDRLCPMS